MCCGGQGILVGWIASSVWSILYIKGIRTKEAYRFITGRDMWVAATGGRHTCAPARMQQYTRRGGGGGVRVAGCALRVDGVRRVSPCECGVGAPSPTRACSPRRDDDGQGVFNIRIVAPRAQADSTDAAAAAAGSGAEVTQEARTEGTPAQFNVPAADTQPPVSAPQSPHRQ